MPKPVKTQVRDVHKVVTSKFGNNDEGQNVGDVLLNSGLIKPDEVTFVGQGDAPDTTYSQLGKDEGYPRGFTPDQMRAVKDSEARNDLVIKSTSGANREDRAHPEHEKSRIREIIARSKIDPSRQFDKFYRGRLSVPQRPLQIVAREHVSGGALGEYLSPTNDINPSRKRELDIRADQLFPEHVTTSESFDPTTLIHELGHDDDYLSETTDSELDPQYKLLRQIKNVSDKIITGAGFSPSSVNQAASKHAEKTFLDARSRIWGMHKGHVEGYANDFAARNFVEDPRDVRKKRPWIGQDNDFYNLETAVAKQRIARGAGDPASEGFVAGFEKAGGKAAKPGANIIRLLLEGMRKGGHTAYPSSAINQVSNAPVYMEKEDALKAYEGDEPTRSN